jgi:hypothetical protein
MQTTGSRREVVITVIPEPRKRPVDLRFGARAEIREHIAECKAQLEVLPADDSDHDLRGHGEPGGLTPAELTAVLARLDRAGLASVLAYAHGFCPEAVESSFVLCQQHGGTFGPADCDACSASARDDTWVKGDLILSCGCILRGGASLAPAGTVAVCAEHGKVTVAGAGNADEADDPVPAPSPDPAVNHRLSADGAQVLLSPPSFEQEDNATPGGELPEAAALLAESIATGRPVIVEDDSARPDCARCGHPEAGHRLGSGVLRISDGMCLNVGCDCEAYAPSVMDDAPARREQTRREWAELCAQMGVKDAAAQDDEDDRPVALLACGDQLTTDEVVTGDPVTCPRHGETAVTGFISNVGELPRRVLAASLQDDLADPHYDATAAWAAGDDSAADALIAADDRHAERAAWPAVPFLPAGLLLAAAGVPCKCGHPERGDDGHEQPDSDDGQPGGCLAGGCGCRSWRPARAKAAGEPSLVVPLIVPGMVIPGDGEARPFPAIGAAS